MSNARKPKSQPEQGSTAEAILGGVARTSVVEVVGRAEAVIDAMTTRINRQKENLDRVMSVFKRAERECTCGAIDQAMEALSSEQAEEAAAPNAR